MPSCTQFHRFSTQLFSQQQHQILSGRCHFAVAQRDSKRWEEFSFFLRYKLPREVSRNGNHAWFSHRKEKLKLMLVHAYYCSIFTSDGIHCLIVLIYFIIVNVMKWTKLSVVFGKNFPLLLSITVYFHFFFFNTNTLISTFLLYYQTGEHRNII